MKRELFVGIGIVAVAGALFAGVPAYALLFGLLILACPLMMLFMGHGGGHAHAGHGSKESQEDLSGRDVASRRAPTGSRR